MKKIILIVAILSLGFLTYSCSDDFTDPQLQQNDIIEDTPITTLEQLKTFMNGTYALMRSKYYYGCDYIVFGEVRGSDEMFSTGRSGRYITPSMFSLNSNDAYASDTWQAIYSVIANANIVINANISDGSSIENVNAIKAEAYAIRAWAYFDLIKLYGQKYTNDKNLGVPLVLENTKEPISFFPSRATLDECYAQIESDFTMAYNNSKNTSTATRLGKGAIAGLMSRYYLYKEDYANVYKYASEVTSKYKPINLGLYVISWRIEGLNSIFELSYGVSGSVGTSGVAYMFWSTGYANVRLNPSLLKAYDPTDIRAKLKDNNDPDDKTGMLRKTSTEVAFLEGKYPILQGEANQKLVRYEEIALNQVEAILMGGGGSVTEALNLINGIRVERGIAPLSTITMTELKEERRKELVGEGFRVWDLLRWNKTLTPVNAAGKPLQTLQISEDYKLAFPIPQKEVDNNPGLQGNQNKKY
ncbi:RagB/SusD family nutrient uptake outer membrane protein [Apibacter adventoris]|uniref:RagB/SusD family nutrient uptake outer membrane protein n=1 Tax=Apibacter adventoris TaxID=1679466 RepID=A0A2S8AE23_9FLAO|nr:RagB/SusD family nutrient uptake outer membrane protein [Apibacter adventoris]PQL93206.1 RagB/SusD family nutrient uptake outer membrane protein [Apibacter adventoris]